MTIVKPGTPIITKIGSMKAIVTGVCIRDESISYEISCFSNCDHKSTWIYRYEFDIDTSVKQKAGLVDFNSPDENSESQLLLTTL